MIPTEKCGLPQITQARIISVLTQEIGIEKAILYGSRAKSTYSDGSDIDLTLIAPTFSLSELSRLEIAIDDLLLPYKIDLSLFHQIDNQKLIDHILRVGIFFTCALKLNGNWPK